MKTRFLIVIMCLALLGTCVFSCAAETTVFGADEMTDYISGLAADVQPGTAGSSLKAVRKCAELMRADVEFALTGAEIADCVRFVMETLDEAGRGDLCAAAAVLEDICDCLTVGDPAPLLDDAGCDADLFVADPAAIGVIHVPEATAESLAAAF